ncbi:MAG: hypothetical protein ACYDHG_17650 [Desulfomonilaceae bacterium]
MVFKLVRDDKHKDRGGQLVALDPRRRRLGLYKEAMDLMTKHHGGSFEHVQIFVDTDAPNRFWLKPCISSADGARKLFHSSPSTRALSISLLLQELNPTPETTLRLPLVWDDEHGAGRVDLVSTNKEGS